MVHRWTGEVAKPAFRASPAGFLDLFPASIQSDISISISMISAWAECISIVGTTIEPKAKEGLPGSWFQNGGIWALRMVCIKESR
jgi:hypothetical protein